MKKQGWLVLLTIGMALILVVCLYIQQRSVPEENPVSSLSFRVFSDETSGEPQEIQCWNQDDERCYVFLPSYADLNRTEVQLKESNNYRLGGIQLTQRMNCGSFSLDTDYELTGEGFTPKILQFVQSANVATMYINTFSGSMERVYADKSYKERASAAVYTANGQVDYQGTNDYIRGRGNSSWYYEKKPYNLYLYQSASLLEMDEATEWVLIANASDNTNLRNKLIYDLANNTSPRPGWAPENEYVDLFLNGEYAGLYLLCEKKENAAYKLKGKKDENITICLNNYITKLDNPETALKLDDTIYAEIVAPSISSAAKYTRLEAFLHEVMNSLSSENWTEYIDLDSFARKYLIEEIFTNTDGGEASQFYYWDQSANKLYAGPCWDYDLTLGDTTWVDWISPYCLKMQSTIWYKELWTHEEFAEYVQKLYYTEYYPLLNQLIEDFPAITENIEKAANANHIRWTKLYEDGRDAASMLQFLSDRVGFLKSLWIDHTEYCEVSFAAKGPRGYPLVSLFVPVNSSGDLVPTPEEVGVEEEYIWYREDNDEPFDYNSIITGDLTLYNKREPVAEESAFPAANFIIKLVILAITIIPFLLLIPILLFIEYRRNRSGRRHGHE